MNLAGAPVRLGAYAAGLALIFVAAAAAGGVVGPIAADAPDGHRDAPASHTDGTGEHDPQPDAAAAPGGLAVSDRGYTLVPAAASLPAGERVPFAFTVTGPDGTPVRDYAVEHDKELHLIVVRRDLSGFQHVHPERDATGTWRVPLDLSAAGDYRVFADFRPAALGAGLTLGVDLAVAGEFAPTPVPTPAVVATVDGYEVRMAGTPAPGRPSELAFTVSRDGRPVTDLAPYLGAYGHLVALRDGDLAYLHTHPEGEARPGQPGGPRVSFATTFPTPGAYRLYLDFQHAGEIHTAEFTVAVGR